MKISDDDLDFDLTQENWDFSLDNIEFGEKLKQLFIATEKENAIIPLFDDDLDSINAARGQNHYIKDNLNERGKQ